MNVFCEHGLVFYFRVYKYIQFDDIIDLIQYQWANNNSNHFIPE